MTDKQINLVKKLDKTVFFDGDTIQFDFIEFDKPIKGVCFNKSVYIPIAELEYILQQLFDKEQESEFSNLKIIQLKETLSQYETELDQLKAENDKLKQTLTEIKPILELYANSKIGEEQPDGTYKYPGKYSGQYSGKYTGQYFESNDSVYINYDPRPAKEGLKKISEVGNEQ